MIKIRPAEIKEFEKFFTIKTEFIKEYKIKEKTREFILSEFKEYLKKMIFIAEESGNIIGYIFGEIEENPYEKTGYISEIFVKKKYRGKGIATELKNKLIQKMKEIGLDKCRIGVNPDNPVLEVYKKWGFKIDKYRMTLSI